MKTKWGMHVSWYETLGYQAHITAETNGDKKGFRVGPYKTEIDAYKFGLERMLKHINYGKGKSFKIKEKHEKINKPKEQLNVLSPRR